MSKIEMKLYLHQADAEEESYLYLMPHIRVQAFKIGITWNVKSRIRDIGNIETSAGIMFRFQSRKDALFVEQHLHDAFREFRIVSCELPSSGKTEWFDKSCLFRLLRYVEDNSDILPEMARVEPDEYLELMPKTLPKPSTDDIPRIGGRRQSRSYNGKKLVQVWVEAETVDALRDSNVDIPELMRCALREAAEKLEEG